uniref:11S globulin n=1 Tax=Wrightia tinctoria TaxID=653463 RepID=A0A162EGL7_9GENT|nr:11S globulin [Wrightia tinctoria]
MASTSFLQVLIALICLVLLCERSCLASRQSSPQSITEKQGIGECDLQRVNPLEPAHRIQHEAGYSEIWDPTSRELQCAGIDATRHVIENRGLFVPSYNNAPMLIIVVQGHGILGAVFPGCPETFQSFHPTEKEGGDSRGPDQTFRDRHQKVHFIRQGDVIALPAGIVHWAYNEATEKLVLLVIHDLSNRENQLDQNLRRYFLGGNQKGDEETWAVGSKNLLWNNVFQPLDPQFLGRASGVNSEIIKKLQSENDFRGYMVRVRDGLRLVRPSSEEPRPPRPLLDNGYEETLCTVRIKENLLNPERADIYTSRGGTVSTLNSYNLPILRKLQLSANREYLYPNAMIVPEWNNNAHSISYVTRGSGRLQVGGSSKSTVYDGDVRQGQLFIIPQNYVYLKQAGPQGLELYTVKTNDRAKATALVGRTSVIRAVPLDVWINVFQLTQDEARSLKYNREEITVLGPELPKPQPEGGGYYPWSIVA